MPSERPTVLHCKSRLEQMPLAHSSPVLLLPVPPEQAVPSGTVASSGHEAADPVHMSATSHSPTEGRQTLVEGLKVQPASQQVDEAGSQTAPLRKRQAESEDKRVSRRLETRSGTADVLCRSQQAESRPPGSQSSPGSTIPLPHLIQGRGKVSHSSCERVKGGAAHLLGRNGRHAAGRCEAARVDDVLEEGRAYLQTSKEARGVRPASRKVQEKSGRGTNISERARRELLLALLRDGRHDELAAGVARACAQGAARAVAT